MIQRKKKSTELKTEFVNLMNRIYDDLIDQQKSFGKK